MPPMVLDGDSFVPELTEIVAQVVLEYDIQLRGLVMKFMIEAAREQVTVN